MSSILRSNRLLRDYRLFLCLCLCTLGITEQIFSTHIVGGSMRYNCLGNDMYEITLTINRDCDLGAENAPFDNPASVGIFDVNGRQLFGLGDNGELFLEFEGDVTLQNQIQQICFTSSNTICVHSTEYKGIVELPQGVEGYVLAYQRCCRNETLLNVAEPLETGLTLSIELTEAALEVCNSSPAFVLTPDIFICVGSVLEFDGSATDADGDQLVYSACTPNTGATIDDPRPQPPAGPPYTPVEYINGFSATNPLGPLDADFNSETGVYTVTPQAIGQYLVGLCVEEFRDGVLLSRVSREFQYNVVRCEDEIVSDFDISQDGCSTNNVQFTNLTPSATNFMWFFDFPSTDPAFTSTDPNPVFDYAEAGNYEVRLVTSREDGSCESISDRNVTISDGQSNEIQSTVLSCDGNIYTIRLSDPVLDRTDRNWLISIGGQQTSASSQFVDIVVERDTRVQAELTATTATGCVETTVRDFNANLIDFNVDLVSCGADGTNSATILLSAEQINVTTESPIVSYDWFLTNGETEVSTTEPTFEVDVNFTNTFWVGLTVVFENGCTAEVERIIRPSGMIELTEEASDLGCSVTFFNFDDVITNYFDNPTSTPSNDPIVQKEWVITSPSQGEIREFGDDISYSTTLNETISVSFFYTTESGCIFEIRTTYTCSSINPCATLGPDDDICAILAEDPSNPLGLADCDGGGADNLTECNNGTDPNNPDDDCVAIIAGGVDICEILADNPNSPLANLDCDGDGFTNIDECNRGSNPNDGCDLPDGETIDICAILAANPDSPLGLFDCDGGGADNATECMNGTNPSDPSDDCQGIIDNNVDICAILAADPDNTIAGADCDNDGVSNGVECNSGTDPLNPLDACIAIAAEGLDICEILRANPNSELADLDCDGDGFSNLDECSRGSDPSDGCSLPAGESVDICAILAADPNSPLGMFDCDGGGVNNADECLAGTNPNDPSDDCEAAVDQMVDICAILAANPNSPLANQDCDGDGFSNIDECNRGSNPTDGCSVPAGETLDICAILAANPDSPLGQFDCDGGGLDNATECELGTDPNNPDDDCQAIIDNNLDICAILAEDPDNTIANADCDNDGISNGDECNAGSDPLDPSDACISIIASGVDICATLAADPDSPLGSLDCDGDGFSNLDECNRGSNPSDGCDFPAGESIDICAILAADPNSPLGMFDCDGGGVNNADECLAGTNPNDPSDDCEAAVDQMVDICAILAANPNSPLANQDCDGDGFSNIDECNRGSNPTDGCDFPAGESIDICAILAANPDSPLGQFDCDGGGADNATECMNGTDPNDPSDDCQGIIDNNVDICAILAADPNNTIAGADCDNDGVSNGIECNNGTDPLNPLDACIAIAAANLDICELLRANPNSELAGLDCDGDGFSNFDECSRGSDPSNGCDFPAGESIDICAILSADPNSPLGAFDCDNGGISNADECLAGTNPNDPGDDCQAAVNQMVDICAILAADPNSPLANQDCDGDGFGNADECNRGSDPIDGCSIPEGESLDICALLALNPNSPLGMFDCDNGGVDNATECENGTDPNDPNDDARDCAGFLNGTADLCDFLANNPNSDLANEDCDGDGFSNIDECNRGSDPTDGCDFPAGETINICALLAADPNSPLGLFDCDNGGISNADECLAGTNPNDPSDDCQAAINGMLDICAIIAADPDSPLVNQDCDGDTFSNIDECNRGSDPTDGCSIPAGESIDICAILAADPVSPLGQFDCDNGGIDNATECENGTDPNDPSDDCEAAVAGMVDICAILAADPNSPLATQDCDNGGIDNQTECDAGTNPIDPADDCEAALNEMVDICALIAADPDNPIAGSDCDGDTFSNQDECDRGSNPSDGCDIPDGEMIDICAILAADPDSPLGMFDCDNGGIDNATECDNGGDPLDPTDECLSAFDDSVDICALLAENPNSTLGDLDCDGDGFTNADECERGSDPADGCDIPDGEMIDICAILAADPDSPLGPLDCDNGGIDNMTECEIGTDPNDPSDECDAIGEGVDICQLLMDNPDSTLGGLDCDGDGVDNATECENGTDPLDPNDNCPIGVTVLVGEGQGIPEGFCAGDDTPISVTVDSTDDLVFEWAPDDCIVSGGDTPNPVINATTSKELTLRVLNNTIGCEMTVTIPIIVSDPSVTIVTDPADGINQGEDVTVTAQTNVDGPIFIWNTGETNGDFDVTLMETTDFAVTVTDMFGCTATDMTTVTVTPASCDGAGIFLPNSFSPNSDGVNDVLFVRSNAIQTLEFTIFDRWGREVFRTQNIDEGWNGRWQNTGDELPSDAYGYWLMATCTNGETFQDQGNVSILR